MTAAGFGALGDPVRRRILECLADGERSVGALVSALATTHRISQPAVSQHLRVLREAGLVRVRADGTRRLYALDPDGLAATAGWLAHLIESASPFDQALDALATEVVRGRRARRAVGGGAPSGAASA